MTDDEDQPKPEDQSKPDEERPEPSRWQQWLTTPRVIFLAVVTTALGSGATLVVNWAGNRGLQALEDPVKLYVETNPALMSGVATAGRSAIIPATVQTHGTPGPGCDGFHSWVVDNKGVDVGSTVLQIAAQGTTDKPVLIQGFRVKIVEKSPPMSGIPVECPTAGNAKSHSITVDLDAPTPTAQFEPDPGPPGSAPNMFNAFTLAKSETELFRVSATASKATYRWKLVLDLVVDGRPEQRELGGPDGYTTAVISDHDKVWEWGLSGRNEWRHYSDTGDDVILAPAPLRPVG